MMINEAIRELRKAYGETQQYFATRLRIAIGSLAYYETGIRSPDLTAALKFSRAAADIGRWDLERFFEDRVYAELGRYALQADDLYELHALQVLQFILKHPQDPDHEKLWQLARRA
jgi:transcriptional regulator with XRE-family HTH domain